MSEKLLEHHILLLKLIFTKYPEPMQFGELGNLYNNLSAISPKDGQLFAETLLFLEENEFIELIRKPNISYIPPKIVITEVRLNKNGIDIMVLDNYLTQSQLLDKMAVMTNTIEKFNIEINNSKEYISKANEKINSVESKIDGFNMKIIEISAVILAIFTFLNIDIKGIDKILYLPWWQALIYYIAINLTLALGIYLVLKLTGMKRKK